MTITMLEEKLKPFGDPVNHPFAKWLYLHFPPRPMTNKKMYDHYYKAVHILMRELEVSHLTKAIRATIQEYLKSVAPFLQDYEKKEFPLKSASPSSQTSSMGNGN